MMKFIFTFFLLLIGSFLYGQAIVIKNAPSHAPGTTDLRLPNGTTSHTSMRGHFLVRSSEMGDVTPDVLFKTIGMSYFRGTEVPAGGTLKLYLENTNDNSNMKALTWTTAINAMTEVYNGVFQLPVGSSPAHVDLTLNGAPFTYTGGALYVAYEYVGSSFSTTSAVNYAQNTGVPLVYVGASITTTPPATLGSTGSGFVPQMRFGWDNPYALELSVEDLSVERGVFNPLWGDNVVTARVINAGYSDQVDIPVTLNITGANTYTTTQTITALAAGEQTTLTFDGILQPNEGQQTITVSIPDDEVMSNNEQQLTQWVSCNEVSYTGSQTVFDGIGFNTGTGILGVRYHAPDVPVSIEGVHVHISDNPNNVNKSVTGVLLNSAGAIVGTSGALVIEAGHLDTRVFFPIATPVSMAPGEMFYVGLLQSAGSPGYFPVATEQPPNSPSGRNFSFPVTGGSGTMYTDLGNFRIGARVQAKVEWERTPTGDVVEGDQVTFTASPGYTEYVFRVNGDIEQQGSPNTFTYVPQDGDEVSLEVAKGGLCAISAEGTFTLRVLSDNADLAGLTLSEPVEPEWLFDTQTTEYTITVPHAVGSIAFTPAVQAPEATVTINGTAVNSGTASDPIALQAGENEILVVVTAESGTTKTYTVKVVRKDQQEIAFLELPDKTYGDATFEVGPVNSTAGLPITYTSGDTDVVTILGNVATIHHAGVAMITATQTGNEWYDPAIPISHVLTINKATQQISFTAPGEIPVGGGTVVLTATASSDLPVTLTVDDQQIATLSGFDLSPLRMGTITLTATQDGNHNYHPADPVIVTVRVVDQGVDFPIRVHRALSPNDDGINDFLIIEGIRDYPDNRVVIFDRSGNIITEIERYDNLGRVFTGEYVRQGTYFYRLDVTINGKRERVQGFFEVRR